MTVQVWLFRVVFFVALIALAVPVFAEAVPANTLVSRNDLIKRFDVMDWKLNRGAGYSRHFNDVGTLAWSQSYLMEAYLDMYEATGEEKYLKSFVRQADRIVVNTDQSSGMKDYKGRSLTGWSATRYSQRGERVVWLVHSGMITYPLARFAVIVNRSKLTAYRDQAESYVALAKDALAAFEKNWERDAVTGGGYYQFDHDEPHATNAPDKPMPLPLNQQLAAGRTFVALYEYTGNSIFKQRAEALARHFKGNLKGSGPYVWTYWHGKGLQRSKGVEDVSHGAIDVDFAIQAYRSGIVFGLGDMTRFRDTYEKNVRRNGTFAAKVDGTGAPLYKEAIGRWLELSEFTCVPWKDYHALLQRDELSNNPQVMLGIAKLIKYYGKCSGE